MKTDRRLDSKEGVMLVLSRKPGDQVVIGGSIRVRVLSVKGNQVRLGFEAPADLPIHREEVLLRMGQWEEDSGKEEVCVEQTLRQS
jgi:carbon storage regulator